MSNQRLSEEKTKSILISSQDIMLLLYPLISSRGVLVSASFKHVYDFFIKVLGCNNLKPN